MTKKVAGYIQERKREIQCLHCQVALFKKRSSALPSGPMAAARDGPAVICAHLTYIVYETWNPCQDVVSLDG